MERIDRRVAGGWPVGRKLRIQVFCIGWIAAQIGVTLWAQFQPGKLFGYQMFGDAQYFTSTLNRELRDGERVHARGGQWRTTEGKFYSWRTGVYEYKLHHIGKKKRAKRSLDLTLKFAQHALDYVADNIPEDHETRRLILVFEIENAVGEPRVVTLYSHDRFADE